MGRLPHSGIIVAPLRCLVADGALDARSVIRVGCESCGTYGAVERYAVATMPGASGVGGNEALGTSGTPRVDGPFDGFDAITRRLGRNKAGTFGAGLLFGAFKAAVMRCRQRMCH